LPVGHPALAAGLGVGIKDKNLLNPDFTIVPAFLRNRITFGKDFKDHYIFGTGEVLLVHLKNADHVGARMPIGGNLPVGFDRSDVTGAVEQFTKKEKLFQVSDDPEAFDGSLPATRVFRRDHGSAAGEAFVAMDRLLDEGASEP
jgi:hypothetical protein